MDDNTKNTVFQAFTDKARKRLQERKMRKYETLYIPSMDENIKIQSLLYPEIVECSEIDDSGDPNKADKYAIYLAVVEPDIKQLAVQLKEEGEIKEYPEVVEIFEMDEISQIATEIMKLSGVSNGRKVTVVTELKN